MRFFHLALCFVAGYAFAQSRWITHVPRSDGGFTATLLVENRSLESRVLQATAYDETGTQVSVISRELAPRSLEQLGISEQFGSDQVAAVALSESSDLHVSIRIQADQTDASPAELPSSDTLSNGWRLFTGNWRVVFDGVAIVNTGPMAADVWIQQRDPSGAVIAQQALFNGLPARAKGLVVLGSPSGQLFDEIPNQRLEVFASQPLSLVALRGSPPGVSPAYLWQNQAEPIELDEPATVTTSLGTYRGEVVGSLRVFRGIPFAHPPLDSLRWQPPVAASSFAGTLDATSFAPPCPQLDRQTGLPEGDEDCLRLNIWAPILWQEPLPVLFYIHGGGNSIGSAVERTADGLLLYDGTALATQGPAIVVTTQYRIGPLGYLAHEDLDANSPTNTSGNYGILDLITALTWVRDHIADFGGDPNRVMIFGQSAGGVNVCSLVASPLANGLFSSAIMQSGGCFVRDVNDVYAMGQDLVEATGCGQSDDPIECMRAITPTQLLLALPPEVNVASRSSAYQPHPDGWVLLEQPLTTIEQGHHSAVPMVIGANADETSMSIPLTLSRGLYELNVALSFGLGLAPLVLEQYSVDDFGSPWAAYVAVTTDSRFLCLCRIYASALTANQSESVYRYFFDETIDGLVGIYGAFHGLELAFLFDWLHTSGHEPNAAEQALAHEMRARWLAFARDGNPNADGLPLWESFDGIDNSLRLNESGTQMEDHVRREKCDFWEENLEP